MRGTILAGLAALSLTACGSASHLHSFGNAGAGPDEFAILPTRPLEMPKSFAALPAPTPGGTNLADPNPVGDALAALGGHEGAGAAIPAADAGLVSAADRYGVDPAIRATLAQEDAAMRARRGRLGILSGSGDRYYRIYAGMALDAYAELARFQSMGVHVPSAPPQ